MRSRPLSSTAIAVNRPALIGPVVVSIPHAGRLYPPEILAAARVAQADLQRLEDSWCDLIAAGAVGAGATVIQGFWGRGVADCNRGEGQMAPGEVAVSLRAQFSAPGRKERAGLGVVPTRLADCGPLWKKPIDQAALQWRLELFHRPYHAALADALAAALDRFGYAVLIDLHSMPPVPVSQPGHGTRVVVGDYFGLTAGEWLVEQIITSVQRLPQSVSRNVPYAGGHIVRAHGRPAQGVHAVQIEIDRSLYLTSDRRPDAAGVARMAHWFAALLNALAQARPGAAAMPQAAE